ncbi:MAG: hypothetical protein ACOY99_10585 [Pseudomonadota bacterium]
MAEALTIVVIPLIGGEALARCLASLAPIEAERIAVMPRRMGALAPWRQRFPAVAFAAVDDAPVPALRAQGGAMARGALIAFIEDSSKPGPQWREALIAAFADPQVAAASGPVMVSPRLPARHQALGFSEYGRFGPRPGDLKTAAAERLPGNHLAYRRAPLMAALKAQPQGLFEADINAWLRAQGYRLAFHPAMAATYDEADHHGARLATRLRHGRLFAARRVAGLSRRARAAWLVKSLALPFLLSGRALRAAMGRSSWPDLARAAWWICLMESAWAVGESIGYLAGEGRSLESWR